MSEDVFDPGGPTSAPRQKRGCLGMSFMIFGIVAAVFMLLCCGGVFFIFNKFRTAVTEKPEEIAAVREKIADINIPPEMQPAFGMDLDMFGFFGMQMVAYGNELEVREEAGEERGAFKGAFLMLMQMKVQGDGQQLEAELRKQSGDQGPDIRVEEREMRTVTINGEEHEFEFARGTNTEDNTKVRSVSGMFRGRGGPTLFMLVVPEENWNEEGWNEERSIQLIESIQP